MVTINIVIAARAISRDLIDNNLASVIIGFTLNRDKAV